MNSKYIDKILLSTDSVSYSTIGKKYGASFNNLRPKKYSTDSADSISVVLYEILNNENFDKNKYDYVVLLEPTSPLTNSKIIDSCLEKLIKNKLAKGLIVLGAVKSQHPIF